MKLELQLSEGETFWVGFWCTLNGAFSIGYSLGARVLAKWAERAYESLTSRVSGKKGGGRDYRSG